MTIARRAVTALFLFLALGQPARAGDEGEELLSRVARKYAATRTLAADFRQEVPLKTVGIVRKARGRVYFERPLRMRWDYRAPDAQLFLADGDFFYFRPPGSAQVFRKRIDEKTLGGKIPVLLLFGKGNLADLFRVERMNRRNDGLEAALTLLPRGDGAPDVRRIDLVVGTGDLLVREVHLYDRLGGSNHLYFSGIAVDPALAPGLFRFVLPAGADLVDG